MGIPISVLGKLGLPGVDSLSTDQVYTKYFGDKKIKTYKDFHQAFLLLCNDFNAIMPGKHYKIKATPKEIEEFFDKEWPKGERDGRAAESGEKETKEQQKAAEELRKTRKDLLVEFMKKHVEEYKTSSSSAMIWVGATAPAAAVLLKKSGEKVPQVKKFRIDLVPNFVFVPTCTLLSLIAVRMVNVTKASRTAS
ncbi:unnamed protein product [Musa acuminata subsp. burmannicoides]